MSISDSVQEPARPKLTPGLIYLTTGLVLVISSWPGLALGAQEHIGLMLRITARLAFVLLLLAYIARPLVQLMGIGRGLLRNRRHLGLSMAFVHTVHFGYVIAHLRHSGEVLEPIVIVFGGLAFVLMWLMAITSNQASRRALGANWRRLHLVGQHYLWLIFMQTFLGVATSANSSPLYWLLVSLGMSALALRVCARIAQYPVFSKHRTEP